MKIKVYGEKCVGCRLCETICVFSHDGEFGSYNARIHVCKLESIGIDYPVVCQQCLSPLCESVCQVNAISKDSNTGAMTVKESLCVGCGKCVDACPYGAVTIHGKNGKANICDLCGGAPTCVNECPTKAIILVDEEETYKIINAAAQQKREDYVRKITRSIIDRWEER